jgi:hypothetical protein
VNRVYLDEGDRYSATIWMRAGGRKNRNNCAEPGPMQALFDGTVLRLACVNRDWAGQAAGPAMSAMPRKRRLARKRRPAVMGQ